MDMLENPVLQQAISLHRKGQIDKARAQYEAILESDPQNTDALTLLSTVDARLGRFEGSRGDSEILKGLESLLKIKDMPEAESAHFISQQSVIELMRRSHYADYPRVVHLETITICNATCTFCPYVDLERIGTRMSDELIQKVLTDLTEIPQNVKFVLNPFKISDPFLEKRLPAIIEEAYGRMPNVSIVLATNGSALTEKNARKLEAVAKRPVPISISVNEYQADTYKQVMGLDFERTVANVRTLHDLAERGEFTQPVSVGRVSSNPQDDAAFMAWARQNFPKFGVVIKGAGNWIGDVASRTRDLVMPLGCVHWFGVSIMATGKLALCCMDAKGVVELGNVKDRSVLELYNAPELRRFRDGMKTRRDGAPCSSCTYPETQSKSVKAGDPLPVLG